VQVVQDREVDQDLVGQVEAEVGLGAEVEEVELQVHSEDGVGVGQPAGEMLPVYGIVKLEDKGGTGTEVGQVTIMIGNGDGNGLNQVADGALVHGHGAGRVKDGLGREESAGCGESGDAIGLDVQANGTGIGAVGCPDQWGLARNHGRWR
jgi:hypothetical protein